MLSRPCWPRCLKNTFNSLFEMQLFVEAQDDLHGVAFNSLFEMQTGILQSRFWLGTFFQFSI